MEKFRKEYYDYTLRKITPDNNNKKIVFDIIQDIQYRRGVGDEFEHIDNEVQDEIIQKWINIVENGRK